jgi:hypothetical protein
LWRTAKRISGESYPRRGFRYDHLRFSPTIARLFGNQGTGDLALRTRSNKLSVETFQIKGSIMSGETIWYFVKFFTEEKYADQFMKGSLYLNRLSYFKKIEAASDDGRPDSNEAVAMWWQPHDVIMNITVPGIGEMKITSADLAAPISMSFEPHKHLHVFCLYAIHTAGFDTIAGELQLTESQADELRKQVAIDARCLKFGSFAVVMPATQFLTQLKTALERNGQWFRGQLVEYYDDETFHGEFASKDIPFMKQKRFCYQKEFRICVQTATTGDDPITIDMGDISHICAKMKSSEIISHFELKSVRITG